jgi:hypothetical protein
MKRPLQILGLVFADLATTSSVWSYYVSLNELQKWGGRQYKSMAAVRPLKSKLSNRQRIDGDDDDLDSSNNQLVRRTKDKWISGKDMVQIMS